MSVQEVIDDLVTQACMLQSGEVKKVLEQHFGSEERAAIMISRFPGRYRFEWRPIMPGMSAMRYFAVFDPWTSTRTPE